MYFTVLSEKNICGNICVSTPQLADLQTDNEDLQRSVQQLKKKCQKLTGELQDTKLHLEGLQSRNHDLEKKQRKSVSNVLRLFRVLITSTHLREFRAPLFPGIAQRDGLLT